MVRKISFDGKKFALTDNEILDVFEKEVTPHGTGAKIPCSSKYIGKKVYVIVRK
jgi:putative transposon-encoded protein